MTGRSLVRIQVGPPDGPREWRSSSEVVQGTHKPLAAGSNPASATGLAEVVKLVDTQSSGGCELRLVRVRLPPSAPRPRTAGIQRLSIFNSHLSCCTSVAIPYS